MWYPDRRRAGEGAGHDLPGGRSAPPRHRGRGQQERVLAGFELKVEIQAVTAGMVRSEKTPPNMSGWSFGLFQVQDIQENYFVLADVEA